MTNGAEEANNDSVYKGIYDKWLTEWWNRRDGLKGVYWRVIIESTAQLKRKNVLKIIVV